MNRIKTMFLTACMLLLLSFCAPCSAAGQGFALHLLDVGQGLSVLVEADGHCLLYDGGGANASSFVVGYLKQQGISYLDYIVASHYDDDHINGIVGALHAFGCGTVLNPDYTPDTGIYRSYRSALQENGADIVFPAPGDAYALGDASIDVIGPSSYGHPVENNNCISLSIEYGNFRFLICGDLEAEGEEELANSIADLSCDLYVVDHHGSSSSSTFYFLDHVLPNYALLSCGAGNPYGHPGAETMGRLQSLGCELYRTDKQGTIIAYSDGGSLWFNVDPCTDWGSGSLPEESENPAAGGSGTVTYVCNTNTYKFHYDYCDSVNKMAEKNKRVTTESRESLIAQGFVPCKNCCP